MSDMCAGCEEPIVYAGPSGLPWGTIYGLSVCSARCQLRFNISRYPSDGLPHAEKVLQGRRRCSALRNLIEQGHEVGEVHLLVETDDEPEWVVGEPMAIDDGVVLEGCFVDRDGREWDEVRRGWSSVYDVAVVA